MKILDLLEEISYPHASIEDTMQHIRDVMHGDKLNYLPLLDDKGNVFGIVDSQVISESHDTDTPIAAQNAWEFCDRDFKVIGTDATIAETVVSMQEMNVSFMLVVDDGRYIGVVTSQLLVNKLSPPQETEVRDDHI